MVASIRLLPLLCLLPVAVSASTVPKDDLRYEEVASYPAYAEQIEGMKKKGAEFVESPTAIIGENMVLVFDGNVEALENTLRQANVNIQDLRRGVGRKNLPRNDDATRSAARDIRSESPTMRQISPLREAVGALRDALKSTKSSNARRREDEGEDPLIINLVLDGADNRQGEGYLASEQSLGELSADELSHQLSWRWNAHRLNDLPHLAQIKSFVQPDEPLIKEFIPVPERKPNIRMSAGMSSQPNLAEDPSPSEQDREVLAPQDKYESLTKFRPIKKPFQIQNDDAGDDLRFLAPPTLPPTSRPLVAPYVRGATPSIEPHTTPSPPRLGEPPLSIYDNPLAWSQQRWTPPFAPQPWTMSTVFATPPPAMEKKPLKDYHVPDRETRDVPSSRVTDKPSPQAQPDERDLPGQSAPLSTAKLMAALKDLTRKESERSASGVLPADGAVAPQTSSAEVAQEKEDHPAETKLPTVGFKAIKDSLLASIMRFTPSMDNRRMKEDAGPAEQSLQRERLPERQTDEDIAKHQQITTSYPWYSPASYSRFFGIFQGGNSEGQ